MVMTSRVDGIGARRAFSLLELVLVLAILSLMVTVAVPRYTSALGRYHVDAAANRVATDLATAQRVARQTSRRRAVTFDIGADTVTYPLPSADHRELDDQVTRLRETPYRAALISADFGGDPRVTFDGFGQASSAGTVVVESHGRQRTIVLDAASGEASVQ